MHNNTIGYARCACNVYPVDIPTAMQIRLGRCGRCEIKCEMYLNDDNSPLMDENEAFDRFIKDNNRKARRDNR